MIRASLFPAQQNCVQRVIYSILLGMLFFGDYMLPFVEV